MIVSFVSAPACPERNSLCFSCDGKAIFVALFLIRHHILSAGLGSGEYGGRKSSATLSGNLSLLALWKAALVLAVEVRFFVAAALGGYRLAAVPPEVFLKGVTFSGSFSTCDFLVVLTKAPRFPLTWISSAW